MKKIAYCLLSMSLLLTGCMKMSDTPQVKTRQDKVAKENTIVENKRTGKQQTGNKLTSELPSENKKTIKPKEPEELKKNRYFTVENEAVKYKVTDQIFLDFGGDNLIWVVMAAYTNKTDEARMPDDFYQGTVVSQTEEVLQQGTLPKDTEGEVTEAVNAQKEAVAPHKTVQVAMIYRVINYMPLNFSFDQDIFPGQKDVAITIN